MDLPRRAAKGAAMHSGRTLLLAVDGFNTADLTTLRDHGPTHSTELPAGERILHDAHTAQITAGGPCESAPALTKLITGTGVARTGIATGSPMEISAPVPRTPWYAGSMRVPTLFDAARAAELRTAALQWPATAGAAIDLCLPLVEDLRHYRDRWSMVEQTSSAQMVREHLAPRRAAGVQLSHVPPDDLVTEIAGEVIGSGVDLAAVRLTGLAAARREHGIDSMPARRTLTDTFSHLLRIIDAFAPTAQDRVIVAPGRPLVPTTRLIHPNTALAAQNVVRTDGTRIVQYRAVVWPDGPHGVVHVRREEGEALRALALDVLSGLAREAGLRLTTVDDGVGATEQTDVLAVLTGEAGVLFGESATHRPIVDGEDPYYAGPRAVSDPTAPITVLLHGPGLPAAQAQGTWADLGVSIAQAMGLQMEGATAAGMKELIAPAQR